MKKLLAPLAAAALLALPVLSMAVEKICDSYPGNAGMRFYTLEDKGNVKMSSQVFYNISTKSARFTFTAHSTVLEDVVNARFALKNKDENLLFVVADGKLLVPRKFDGATTIPSNKMVGAAECSVYRFSKDVVFDKTADTITFNAATTVTRFDGTAKLDVLFDRPTDFSASSKMPRRVQVRFNMPAANVYKVKLPIAASFNVAADSRAAVPSGTLDTQAAMGISLPVISFPIRTGFGG